MNAIQPTDQPAMTSEVTPEISDKTCTDASIAPHTTQSASDKQRHLPSRQNPKGFYRGQKIGNGPRGSRRSMGKR